MKEKKHQGWTVILWLISVRPWAMKLTDKKLNIKEDAEVTQALHRFTEARKKTATTLTRVLPEMQ